MDKEQLLKQMKSGTKEQRERAQKEYVAKTKINPAVATKIINNLFNFKRR